MRQENRVPAVSIIIPVYNVEKFLPRCVSSIFNQRFANYELLLIDDGSTDGSGEICDGFASRDSRVRVFHKPNGGAASARNYGLERARGEYLAFIDADDYIGPDYLSLLSEMIRSERADVAVVTARETAREECFFLKSDDSRRVLEGNSAFKETVWGRFFGVAPWGKLFRKEIFEAIRFPEGILYEDLYTIPYAMDLCAKAVYSTSVQYYYYQRKGSLAHSISEKGMETWVKGMEKLYTYTECKYPELLDCVTCRYINHSFPNIINNFVGSVDYKERARSFEKLHGEWWANAEKNPFMTKKQKIRLKVFNANPTAYRLLLVLWQKWKLRSVEETATHKNQKQRG